MEMVCFDLETGGLNPFKNGVCSITLKVVGKEIIKNIFIKPQRGLTYEPIALQINGLDLEYLERVGVTEGIAIQQIKEFFRDNFNQKPNMLAHNIVFDIQFMNAMFQRNRHKLFSDLCWCHPQDTMIYMSMLKQSGIVNLRSIKLTECYKYFFGKYFEKAHTSEADVRACEAVFFKIKELLESKNGKEVVNN